MPAHDPAGADALLRTAVSVALGSPVDALHGIRREALDYDAFFAHRSVVRVLGDAVVNGEVVRWSLIEKRTEGPLLADRYIVDNGRRELDAYSSGLLDDIAPGVRAPRAFARHLDDDGGVTLLIEDVHHDGPRPLDADSILTAARHLGAMNGRWSTRANHEPWLFRGWIDRHGQPEAVAAGLAALRRRHPAAVARLGAALPEIEQLVLGQGRVREVLESLPPILCHHDAVGANVFESAGDTVLIDWESVGPGAVGADLASLLFSSARRGDASSRTVAPIIDEAVGTYFEGLRTETRGVVLEQVRRGFDAAISLRWKLAVDIVAGLEKGEPHRRGSAPDESPDESLDELLLLTEVLLGSARRTLA